MDSVTRSVFFGVLGYTCVEGLVTNVTNASTASFIVKDALLLLVYLAVAHDAEKVARGKKYQQLTFPIAAFAATVLTYVLLNSHFGLLASAVAAKQRLYYLPLIFVGLLFVRSGKDVQDIANFFAIAAIPVAIFGIYLYFAGPSGLRAIGGSYSVEYVTPVDSNGVQYWRVPGTFSSPGQYGSFLYFVGLLDIGQLLTNTGKMKRLLIYPSLVATVAALLCSGSRGPFVCLTLGCVFVLIALKSWKPLLLGALGLTVIGISVDVLGDSVGQRFLSIGNEESIERVSGTLFGQLFLAELARNPFGTGLARATLGVRHITIDGQVGTLDTDTSGPILMESYLGILAIETGVPGLACFLWLTIAVVESLRRAWSVVRPSPIRPLLACLGGYVLVNIGMLTNSASLDAAPSNVYFWMSVGLVLGAARAGTKKEERSKHLLLQRNQQQRPWATA